MKEFSKEEIISYVSGKMDEISEIAIQMAMDRDSMLRSKVYHIKQQYEAEVEALATATPMPQPEPMPDSGTGNEGNTRYRILIYDNELYESRILKKFLSEKYRDSLFEYALNDADFLSKTGRGIDLIYMDLDWGKTDESKNGVTIAEKLYRQLENKGITPPPIFFATNKADTHAYAEQLSKIAFLQKYTVAAALDDFMESKRENIVDLKRGSLIHRKIA